MAGATGQALSKSPTTEPIPRVPVLRSTVRVVTVETEIEPDRQRLDWTRGSLDSIIDGTHTKNTACLGSGGGRLPRERERQIGEGDRGGGEGRRAWRTTPRIRQRLRRGTACAS